MGADQSLIKAAAAMAPKQWDYSGIMKGIAALGKYAARKREVADKLTTYGDAEINVKEMPPEMMTGALESSCYYSKKKPCVYKKIQASNKNS